jgi:chemotaxis protein histidine kinase CheA
MASDDDFARQLEAFGVEYRQSLPQRIRDIESLWASARQDEVSAERMHALLRGLHSIAGSGRTFGMAGLSEAAAAAESWLEPYCERVALPDAVGCVHFDGLLAAVKRCALSA